MRLYLIRHGESETNRTKQFTGQTDVALTELGLRQAACVAGFFQTIPLNAVYASDLSRAMDTARPTAQQHGLAVQPEPDLREVYAGEWEGHTFEELPGLFPEGFRLWRDNIGTSRCTGGESMAEAVERADAALRRIAAQHPDDTVAVASHGGIIRGLIALWTLGSVAAMRDIEWSPNASVTEAVFENGEFRVLRTGMTEHLGKLVTVLPGTV